MSERTFGEPPPGLTSDEYIQWLIEQQPPPSDDVCLAAARVVMRAFGEPES